MILPLFFLRLVLEKMAKTLTTCLCCGIKPKLVFLAVQKLLLGRLFCLDAETEAAFRDLL